MKQLHEFEIQIGEVPDEGSVEVRVMPYNAPSERTDFWTGETRTIQFDPGSLTVDGVTPLTLDHSPGTLDRIGVLTDFRDAPEGLYAMLDFAPTQNAQDARALLKMGAIEDVSAGVYLDDSAEFTTDDGVTHLSGAVDHVAIVAHGQFGEAGAGSKVLAVHSTTEGAEMPEDTEAPVVEPVEVDYASAKELEELRATVTTLSMPGAVNARNTDYQSLGDVFVDVNAHARGTSPEATERLTPLIDSGLVSADGKGISLKLEQFAFAPPPGNSVGNGVAFDAYIPDLLELLRQGRPTADLLAKRQLPAEGNRVFMPAVTVGNIVGYQEAQGDTLAQLNQVQILTDVPKVTIGGGQGVSIQAQLWTNPSYMEAVASDLVEAYAEFQNSEVVNGDGIGAHYEGILEVVGTTDVPVGGAPLAMIPLLGTAWAAVWTGTRRAPTHALMTAAMWGALLNEVDTDGRPIIQNIAPSNPVGTGDAGSPAGTLRGLTVVIDDSIGDTDVVVTNFRDTLLFEDGSPAQLRLTYPDVLVTDISIFGFSALFIRRPAAYAILSGITIP